MTTTADTVAEFVERQRRERIEAGLPPSIVDAGTIAMIAALIGGGRNESN
jgi:hypothetical protein